jgi:hypothetical protein
MKPGAGTLAERLNRDCDCSVTDLAELRRRVDTQPQVFSELPVFLDPAHVAEMRRVIGAVEACARLPNYRDEVLAHAPSIARIDPRALGVFMGFDFHITPDGPRLIEINTNAGGAFLNLALHDAQRACCEAAGELHAARPSALQLENELFSMFQHEWMLARGSRPLRTIAIVDTDPAGQFLYPEFELARKMFESRGIRTHIADPKELELTPDGIRLRGDRIDLVYNRLTDFYFDDAAHQPLRRAYELDQVVVTPHPRAHALFANKRNLTLLSDPDALEGMGAAAQIGTVLLRGIPQTREVAGGEEGWWRDRKDWFFKPRSGFGSRGAYRGDKLTRRVFAEVVKGGYIAQELTPPGERWRSAPAGKEVFKVDVRCYVYAGVIQLMAARLYQGQTTNFRTAGGGFAPVYVIGNEYRDGAQMEACG